MVIVSAHHGDLHEIMRCGSRFAAHSSALMCPSLCDAFAIPPLLHRQVTNWKDRGPPSSSPGSLFHIVVWHLADADRGVKRRLAVSFTRGAQQDGRGPSKMGGGPARRIGGPTDLMDGGGYAVQMLRRRWTLLVLMAAEPRPASSLVM
ncbi:unnamed protein product [Merluccius merluccius]